MELIRLRDIFDVRPIKFSESQLKLHLHDRERILESVVRKSKDGLNRVLGILEGPFFVPDGVSRNGRFYSRELWEKVIAQHREDIRARGRLGTLEHPEKQEEAHPQHASHVLKDLWIKGNLGYGKAYILSTPMGALVHTLASATDEEGRPLTQIYVSSRALGTFLGKDQDGNDIVDPDNYIFETFDVVLSPGFLEAQPEFRPVLESLIREIMEIDPSRSVHPVSHPEPKRQEVRKPEPEPEPVYEGESDLRDIVLQAGRYMEERLAEKASRFEGDFDWTSSPPPQRDDLFRMEEALTKLREENQELKKALLTLKESYQKTYLELLSYRYDVTPSEVRRLWDKFKKLELVESFLEELHVRLKSRPRTRTVQLDESARIEYETPPKREEPEREFLSEEVVKEVLRRFGRD